MYPITIVIFLYITTWAEGVPEYKPMLLSSWEARLTYGLLVPKVQVC